MITQIYRMNLSTQMQKKLEEYKEVFEFIQSSKDIIQLPEEILDALDNNISRLEKFQFSIAAFGEVNSGKSALLNTLIGVSNDIPEESVFEVSSEINHWSDSIAELNGKEVMLGEDINTVFYDTPGIAGDIEQHKEIALTIAKNSDLLLFVLFEPIKGELQVPVIKELLQTGKEYIFVINKIDIRRLGEIEAIKKDIVAKFGVSDDKIVRCAGYPINGGEPQVEELVEKIVSVLTTLQGELITHTIETQLNKPYQKIIAEMEEKTRRQQKLIEEKYREMELKEKQDKKDRLILDHFIIHGAAVGAGTSAFFLAQVPIGDELALTTITTVMTTALCKNYSKLSRQLVLTYLNVISGTLLGKMGASYLYRFLPGLGNIINSVVTISLHEVQGWLVVTFLEKGLYSAADIKKEGIENLKKESEQLKKTADAARNAPEMSAEHLKALKKQAEEIHAMSRELAETMKE